MIATILLAVGWTAVASAQTSPLDRWDGSKIPSSKRSPGQPKEVVAVLGESQAAPEDKDHISFSVAFSPTGKMLGATVGDLRLWKLEESGAREYARLPEPTYGKAWAFAPDGKMLATGSGNDVTLWDLTGEKPAERAVLRGQGISVNAIAFAPDGKIVATVNHDGVVRCWTLSGGESKELPPLEGHENYLTTAAFAPVGKILASGSRDRTVRLWDLAASPPKQKAVLEGHRDNLLTIAFSPDGKALASSGREETVHVWDLSGSEPKERATLGGHSGWVRSAVFLRDGKELASLDNDGHVFFWDLASAQKLREWKLGGNIAFHGMDLAPDGRHLAIIDETTLIHVLRLSSPSGKAGK